MFEFYVFRSQKCTTEQQETHLNLILCLYVSGIINTSVIVLQHLKGQKQHKGDLLVEETTVAVKEGMPERRETGRAEGGWEGSRQWQQWPTGAAMNDGGDGDRWGI